MDNQAAKSRGLGKHLRHVGRLTQIVNVLARHGFWSVLERARIRKVMSENDVKKIEEASRLDDASSLSPENTEGQGLPVRLRRAFEELGPTFVKLGQLLAMREDLLPRAFLDELKKLHTNVTPIPFRDIEAVLVEELGKERLEQLTHIDPEPLAAGSIGQVHRAELRDGTHVVVKVQRPGIAQQMRVDVSLLEMFAGLVEKYLPELAFLRPQSMIDEFARSILAELDFVREGANASKLAGNFTGVPYVTIPKVYWELTTGRVLVTSLLEGQPLSDRAALRRQQLDPALLLDRSVSIFMKMVFIDGVYHGDLHPGNIMAQARNHIGLLDFGVTVRISRHVQQNLAGLLLALLDEKYETLVAHFLELSDPDPDFNVTGFTHEITNTLSPFVGLSLKDMRTGRLLWELAGIAARHGSPMPSELILFLRTVACFEGIAHELDPHFDIIAACRKYADAIVKQMYAPEHMVQDGYMIARDLASLMRHAPVQARRILKLVQTGQLSMQFASEDLLRLAYAFDKASARVSVGLVLGSFIIGSSMIISTHGHTLPWSASLLGTVGYGVAAVLGIYLIWSLFRGNLK